MGLDDRIKATAKNIEGKVQEAAGEVTGDPRDRIEGQAKQQQAQSIHAAEDVKDVIKEHIDNI